MDPTRFLKDRFDAAGFTGRSAAAEIRARFIEDGCRIIALHRNRPDFVLSRAPLAEKFGRTDRQIRSTIEGWIKAGVIEQAGGGGYVGAKSARDPNRYVWSVTTCRALGTARPVAPSLGRLADGSPSRRPSNVQENCQTSNRIEFKRPTNVQDINSGLVSHHPLRCHSEGSENPWTFGQTSNEILDVLIQKDPSAEPEFPPLHSLEPTRSFEKMTARFAEYDARRREALTGEQVRQAAQNRVQDRYHPDAIMARNGRAPLILGEAEADYAARDRELQDRFRTTLIEAADRNKAIKAKLVQQAQERRKTDPTRCCPKRPPPAGLRIIGGDHVPPVYRPVGRDEPDPDAWEAKIA